MFRVFIADDEEIVRNGLKTIINWHTLGFEICGEATNGYEAIEKIEQLKPHLVLLDIKMPGVSGVDCLIYFSEKKSETEFIIISGFSDFSYAQNAVNYGAKGYLIKPIDESLLEEKVIEITESLKNRIYLQDETRLIEKKKYLTKIFITGKVFSEHDFNDNSKYQIALIHVSFLDYEKRISEIEIFAEEILKNLNYISMQHNGDLVLIFENENQEKLFRFITRFCENLKQKDLENITGPFVTIGSQLISLNGLLDSYYEAVNLFRFLFYFSDGFFITKNQINENNIMSYKISDSINSYENTFFNIKDEILSYIEIYDLQRIELLLIAEKQKIIEICLDSNKIKKICIAFIVDIQNLIYIKHPEKKLTTVSAFEIVNLVMAKKYFFEVFEFVENFIISLAESFSMNTSNYLILKVIQYVKTNYKDDLKLEFLGELFNSNSAYLGKKFKEYTGVPFNTYLDVIRIDAAKEYLKQSDLKVYEISKLVGYSNTDYFFIKFKKHTNTTPKKFKYGDENTVDEDTID